MGFLIQIDQTISLAIYQITSQSLVLTWLAKFFAVYAIGLLMIGLTILVFKSHWAFFLSSLVGLGAIWIFNLLLSILVSRPRPFVANDQIIPIIDHQADWSFPSDHTAIAFAIAYILANFSKNKISKILLFQESENSDRKIGDKRYKQTPEGRHQAKQKYLGRQPEGFLFLVAGLIGLSRIAVGVHYFGDVIFGALIGYFGSLLWYKLTKTFDKRLEKEHKI